MSNKTKARGNLQASLNSVVVENTESLIGRMGFWVKNEQDEVPFAHLSQEEEVSFPSWEPQLESLPQLMGLEDGLSVLDYIEPFQVDHPTTRNEIVCELSLERNQLVPTSSKQLQFSNASRRPEPSQRNSTLNPTKLEQVAIRSEEPLCQALFGSIPRLRAPCNKPPKRWTHEEEVHFIGSVFLVFTEKGSLFPAKRKGRGAGGYTRQCESDTFERVNELFERSKAITGQPHFEPRTSKALCRHLKQMKQRYITPDSFSGKREPGFLPLIYEWLGLCGKEMFRSPEKISFPRCDSKKSWEIEEEILLIGAAFERFFSRGSLCTNTRAKGAVHCWREVKYLYDLAWIRLGMVKPKERGMNELSNHYKKIKKRTVHTEGSCDLKPYIQAYLRLEKGTRPAQALRHR